MTSTVRCHGHRVGGPGSTGGSSGSPRCFSALPCPPWRRNRRDAHSASVSSTRRGRRAIRLSKGSRLGSRSSASKTGPMCCSTSASPKGSSTRCPRPPRPSSRPAVDLIFTSQEAATHAAKAATETVPIVFTLVGDPVGAGIVGKLVQPGGNVTGVSSLQTELAAKRLEVLKTLARCPPSLGHLLQNRHGHHADDHQGARGGAAHEAGALA